MPLTREDIMKIMADKGKIDKGIQFFPGVQTAEQLGTVKVMRDTTPPDSPMELLSMRMRWNRKPYEIIKTPFDYIDAHVTETLAVVFFVKDGKPGLLEDDVALFPSDNLITQLRLLVG